MFWFSMDIACHRRRRLNLFRPLSLELEASQNIFPEKIFWLWLCVLDHVILALLTVLYIVLLVILLGGLPFVFVFARLAAVIILEACACALQRKDDNVGLLD
ncbi:uncharacterized protein F5147DRAFT_726806 [Suillus discolor]|uniref:Uncharacterized protein n=1 Tax=Suillus discolor TaxID=1912936 RepID=A0A9P7ETN0_9AGAM|nr:uncharacterized protein F5147DRAFT_726806 [Suillus discolor]KAG2088562.1 hypothetical protein F5147DRAFT_726806 [Suillus discolor]